MKGIQERNGPFAGVPALVLALGMSGCALLPAPDPYPALAREDLAVHAAKHRVGILDAGWEALRIRIHLIRSAQDSIELQTYIWDDDEVGRLIAYELIQAARRGVKVRLIVDKMFAGSERAESLLALVATAHPDLELKLYNPHAGQVSASWIALLAEVLTNFNGINQRAHDKLMIVDGTSAVIGGRNIANVYYDYGKGMNFKDREVLVRGPVLADMQSSFERFWAFKRSIPGADLRDVRALVDAGKYARWQTVQDFEAEGILRDIETSGMQPDVLDGLIGRKLRVVDAVAFSCDLPGKSADLEKIASEAPGLNPITPTLAGLLRSAEESILIQTPYLVLGRRSQAMFEELRHEHPELSIRVSTNSLDSTDYWPIYSSSYRQKRTMIEQLRFHIYEFKARPGDLGSMSEDHERLAERTGTDPDLCLHSKSLVLDGEIALIGSHNLDPRSDHHNTEVMLLVWDAEFAGELARSIERDVEPQNSWTVWKRRRPTGWRYAEEALDWVSGVISDLTTIDLWPSSYSSSYQLREGGRPVPPGDPEFYANYRSVGLFPEVSVMNRKRVLAPVFKVVIGVTTPLL
jgi:putative cardiolipin synthase